MVWFSRTGQTAARTSTVKLAIGHHRGALRDLLRALEQDARALGGRIAEIPPARGVRRDDVRLLTALGDDAVRRHRRLHVLAILREADIHQHDGVERVAAFPGRDRRMRGLAAERELGRDRRALDHAVVGAEPVEDVIVEGEIDIVEQPVAHEIRTAQQLLFGGCTEDLERAGKREFLHRVADRQRGRDHHGGIGVVPLAMARRAGDDLGALRDAGLLAVRRIGIVFGVDRDDRRAVPIGRDERRRKARNAALDAEAVPLEDRRSSARPMRCFLHAELAEIEDRIVQRDEGPIIAVDEAGGECLRGIRKRAHGLP